MLADVFLNENLFALLDLTDQLLFLELNALEHRSQENEAVDSAQLGAHVKLQEDLLPLGDIEFFLDPNYLVGFLFFIFVFITNGFEISKDFYSFIPVQDSLNNLSFASIFLSIYFVILELSIFSNCNDVVFMFIV